MVFVGALKTIGLAAIVLLFAANFAVLATLHSAQSTFLDSSFYKNQLEKQGAYSEIKGLVSQGIAQGIGGDGEITGAVSSGISTEFVKTETERIIDELLAYLKGKRETFTAKISVREMKRGIAESAAEQLYGEMNGLEVISREELEASILEQLSIPDEISLVQTTPEQLSNAKKIVEATGSVSLASIIIAIMLAGLITALTFRSLRETEKWLGLAFLVAGIGVLLAAAVLSAGATGVLSGQELPSQVAGFANAFVSAAIGALSQKMMLFGGGAIIIGVVLIAAMLFSGNGKMKEEWPELKMRFSGKKKRAQK